MKEKTIPWGVIERRLTATGKDRAWFQGEMGVGKNVVTNWKSRGVPKRLAHELSKVLKISADLLLATTIESTDLAALDIVPGAPRLALAPDANQEPSVDEILELIAAYRMLGLTERQNTLRSTQLAAERSTINRGIDTADKH